MIVSTSYQAAASSGTGFKLFLSFDMRQASLLMYKICNLDAISTHLSALPCSSPSDAQTLRNYISTYASHSNQLIVNGRVFASTFSGETCTFGQGSVQQGWQSQFVSQLTGANAVNFVPSFFVDTSTFGQYDGIINGMFNVSSRRVFYPGTASDEFV